MTYAAGDAALLVTDHPEGLLVKRAVIEDVRATERGQSIRIGGQFLEVDPKGVGDHPGVSVLPIDSESAHQLVLGGGNEFIARLSTIDRDRPIERDDRDDLDRGR